MGDRDGGRRTARHDYIGDRDTGRTDRAEPAARPAGLRGPARQPGWTSAPSLGHRGKDGSPARKATGYSVALPLQGVKLFNDIRKAKASRRFAHKPAGNKGRDWLRR